MNDNLRKLDTEVGAIADTVEAVDTNFDAKADKVTTPGVGNIAILDANGNLVDGGSTIAEVGGAAAVATHEGTYDHTAIHARSHALNGASDHTSAATSGQMLKADANGLPVDAANTNVEVAAAVTASHARSHALNGGSDHTFAGTENNFLGIAATGLPKDSGSSAASFVGRAVGEVRVQIQQFNPTKIVGDTNYASTWTPNAAPATSMNSIQITHNTATLSYCAFAFLYVLPSNFLAFDTNAAITLNYKTVLNASTNNHLDVAVYKNGTEETSAAHTLLYTNNAWGTHAITKAEMETTPAATWVAGDKLFIVVRGDVNNTATAMVEIGDVVIKGT